MKLGDLSQFKNLRVVEDDKPTCPKCFGSGKEIVEGGVKGNCSCQLENRVAKRLAEAEIPERFSQAAFSTYNPYSPALQEALQKTQRFVADFPGNTGLLLMGSCGVGKTHLACASLVDVIRKDFNGMFYDSRDLLKAIQDSWNPNTKTSELELLAPVINCDLLVLDELGASRPTDWVLDTLTHLINRRYLNRKPVIFTTNYLDVPTKEFPEPLTDRIGRRFRSRLREMCQTVLIKETRDYREQLASRGNRLKEVQQ